MTTTVKVTAHCNEGFEVRVDVIDDNGLVDSASSVIQDGESAEVVVFDDRFVTVREVAKAQ